MTRDQVKAVLARVSSWPQERQEELARLALEIEAEFGDGTYNATPEELQAIDDADHSGVATATKSKRRSQRSAVHEG